MQLVTDSREKCPLDFTKWIVPNVSTRTMGLLVGDYTAVHELEDNKEEWDETVIERKETGDLFLSFSSGYTNEKAKIIRAIDSGKHYVLAIEGTLFEVLKGHTYWKDGKTHESKKSGISMVRQLMTLTRKYGVELWFCASRSEMAFRTMEYFLARTRMLNAS